jgi:hypothetical protein
MRTELNAKCLSFSSAWKSEGFCVKSSAGFWQSDVAKKNCSVPTEQPSGYYMYRQFNIQQFYVLLALCIYVFCVDLRRNSDYFPIQH